MNNKMYISGPITGINYDKAVAAFADAEDRIRQWQYEPVNPINNGVPHESPWHEHMLADLQLLSGCGAIFMLSDWERSTGARIEHDFAIKMGIPIIYHEVRKHFAYPVIGEQIV